MRIQHHRHNLGCQLYFGKQLILVFEKPFQTIRGLTLPANMQFIVLFSNAHVLTRLKCGSD